jgi:hypothetical protein
MKQQINEQLRRMQKLAGINEIKINNPSKPYNYYGEIQAAENEFAGGMETGNYTKEEYLIDLLNASNEELEDLQGGYYDIANILSDLNDEEKQNVITNIKNWAKSKL